MRIVYAGVMAAGLIFIASSAFADAPSSVQITVQPKHELGKMASSGKDASKKTDKVLYLLTLTNTTFHDLPGTSPNSASSSPSGLEVVYRVYVERQRLGEKKGDVPQVERIEGSAPLGTLKGQTSATVSTSEIPLTTSNLSGQYIYRDGGRIRAEDSIVGFWIRVMSQGAILGEYVEPSSVTQRGWDKK